MDKEKIVDLFDLYLRGQATEAECHQLIDWLSRNRKLQTWLDEQILQTSDTMDAQKNKEMLDKLLRQIQPVTDLKQPVRRSMRLWKIAAAIAIPLLVVTNIVWWQQQRKSTQTEMWFIAEKGQMTKVILPDSSIAWLNSDSRIHYTAAYNKFDRSLYLEGEAYFEVAHDTKRPFIVHSRQLSVEALGTAFGLKCYPNELLSSASLTHGKVRVVTPENKYYVLHPADKIIYNNEAKTTELVSFTPKAPYLQWTKKEQYFENESLQEIAATIERNFNVTVCFANDKIGHQRFTGTLSTTSLEDMLNVISLSSGLSVQRTSNGILLQ